MSHFTRPSRRLAASILALFALAAGMTFLASACGSGSPSAAKAAVIDAGDGGKYAPVLDPKNFVPAITNPYLPLTPGSRWVYQSADGKKRTEVVVQRETLVILGITATVARETVTVDGVLAEDTFHWFAQDKDGNVWYLGEDVKNYKDGNVVDNVGSWKAGVKGAHPGYAMLAKPGVGRAYRQEFFKGEAEDLARVIAIDGKQTVKFGAFESLVVTKEWTPLEAANIENKYYASGVGMVLELKVAGGSGRAELVSYEPGK